MSQMTSKIEAARRRSMADECIGIDQQFPRSMSAGRDATCSRRSWFAWDLTGSLSRSGDMEGNVGAAWEPECLFGRQGGETVTQTDQGGATSHPLWQLDAVPAAPAWQDAAPVPEY
jgi:hypothetical protein